MSAFMSVLECSQIRPAGCPSLLRPEPIWIYNQQHRKPARNIPCSLSGHDWAEARKAKYELEPGQTEKGFVLADAPCLEGIYDLELKSAVLGHENVSSTDKIRLNTLSKQSCFLLKPDESKAKVFSGNVSSAITTL